MKIKQQIYAPEKIQRLIKINSLLLLILMPAGHVCLAQTPVIPPEASGRLGPERLEQRPLPAYEAPSAPLFELPPVVPSPEGKDRLSSGVKIFVRKFVIEDNTVFSDTELSKITAPYENRVITAEELQEVRHKLTLHYVNHGYVNSGVMIPDQRVEDGGVRIQVIEGRLAGIEISGNDKLREGYIRKRAAPSEDKVLNIQDVQARLQLLQQAPMVERLNAELAPGARPGEAALKVRVTEATPWDFALVFANDRPPSVGAERAEVYAAYQSLTGWGDTLGLRYGLTDGADDVSGFYAVPLNAQDTTLTLSASRSDSSVIEEPFSGLGIDSELESYGLALTHPLLKTPTRDLSLGLSLEKRHSETFLLGIPFSFSPGVQNGESDVTVLRFSQFWLDRGLTQVIAARSTFSWGIDAFGITNNVDAPDGQFVAWLGQFQYARRFGERGNQLIFRTDAQLAEDSLLPLEQFAVGGASTVRGYRENQLVRDNGVIASLEFRIPVLRLAIPKLTRTLDEGFLQIAPFADFGWAGNTDIPTPEPETISSVGLGLRYDPSRNVHAELYWGYALRDLDSAEYDLQDDGIHFRLALF